jgi:hypothetical protein
VVCDEDEDLVECDDHDECEDDSQDEILNHEHEKQICQKI